MATSARSGRRHLVLLALTIVLCTANAGAAQADPASLLREAMAQTMAREVPCSEILLDAGVVWCGEYPYPLAVLRVELQGLAARFPDIWGWDGDGRPDDEVRRDGVIWTIELVTEHANAGSSGDTYMGFGMAVFESGFVIIARIPG